MCLVEILCQKRRKLKWGRRSKPKGWSGVGVKVRVRRWPEDQDTVLLPWEHCNIVAISRAGAILHRQIGKNSVPIRQNMPNHAQRLRKCPPLQRLFGCFRVCLLSAACRLDLLPSFSRNFRSTIKLDVGLAFIIRNSPLRLTIPKILKEVLGARPYSSAPQTAAPKSTQ